MMNYDRILIHEDKLIDHFSSVTILDIEWMNNDEYLGILSMTDEENYHKQLMIIFSHPLDNLEKFITFQRKVQQRNN